MATDKLEEAIRIVLETEGAEGVEQLRGEFLKLGNQSEKTAKETREFVRALDALSETAEKAAKLVRLNQQVSETSDNMAKAAERVIKFREEIAKTEAPTEEQTKALEKAEDQLDRLTKRFDKQSAAAAKLDDELTKSGVNTKKLATEVDRLEKEVAGSNTALINQAKFLKNAADTAERNARAYEAFSKKLKEVRKDANEVAERLVKISAAAAASAGALAAYGTARFFTDAVKDAATFEQAIDSVGAVTGATADQLERLRDAARQASLETGRSAEEAAKGLDEIARATGDAETAIAALPAVLNLATVGQTDITTAAKITTATLAQFGLQAEETARVVNTIASVANLTSASVEDVGNSLKIFAPIAKQVGLTIEEAGGYVAAFAKQGIDASTTGTALRNAFTQTLDPTKKFTKALAQAGIDTSDFSKVLQELAKRGEEGRQILFKLGTETSGPLLALFADGGKAVREFTTQLQTSDLTVDKVAQQLRDNLAGASADAKNAYDDLRKELVRPLLEPLKNELAGLADALEEFTNSPEFAEIQGALVEVFNAATTAAKNYIAEVDFKQLAKDIREFADDSAEKLKTFGDNTKEVLSGINTALGTVTVAFNALQTGILGAASAVTALAAIQSKVTAPIARLNEYVNKLNPALQLFDMLLGEKLPNSADTLAEASGGLMAVSQEFANRTIQNANETSAAIDGLGTALDDTGAKAETAGPKITQFGIDTRSAFQTAAESYGVLQTSVADFGFKMDEAGQKSGDTTSKIVSDAEAARVKLGELLKQASEYAREVIRLQAEGASSEAIEAAQDRLTAVGELIKVQESELDKIPPKAAAAAKETKKAGEEVVTTANAAIKATEEVQAAAAGGQTASLGYTDALAAFIATFKNVSQDALDLFLDFQRGTIGVGRTMENTNRKLIEAAEATFRAIDAQKAQVAGLNSSFDDLAANGQAATIAFQQFGQDGGAALQGLINQLEEGNSSFRLLNQADLNQLKTNALAAAAAVARIKDEATQATEELENVIRALKDTRDQRLGDEEAIEERRFQDEVDRIEELARKGGESARAAAAAARQLAEEEHRANLDRIEAEKRAKIKADQDAKRETGSGGTGGSSGGGAGSGAATANASNANGYGSLNGNNASSIAPVFNFGTVIGSDPAKIAMELARLVRPELARLDKLRGN